MFAKTVKKVVTAGNAFPLDYPCTFFKHISGPDIIVSDEMPSFEMKPGVKIKFDKLTQLTIKPLASGTVYMRVCAGCEVEDTNLSIEDTLMVAQESPKHFKALDDGSCLATASTSIMADNSARVEAIITNLSTSVTLRLGSDGTVPTATKGKPLVPGETQYLNTQDEIRAYNPDASAVSVALAYTEVG